LKSRQARLKDKEKDEKNNNNRNDCREKK